MHKEKSGGHQQTRQNRSDHETLPQVVAPGDLACR
jgi:hypothetical protein